MDSFTNLRSRLYGLVERGSVVLSTASTKLQALQLKVSGEATDDDLEHFEPYGITGRPKDPDSTGTAEAVALSLGGNRDHQIVICVSDRRFRITGLDKGEVAVYNFTGANLKIDDAGNLIMTPKAGEDVLLGGPGATKEVARKGDAVTIDATTDAPFNVWRAQVETAINALAVVHNVTPPAPIMSAAGSVVPIAPLGASSVDGKITEGSATVKATD